MAFDATNFVFPVVETEAQAVLREARLLLLDPDKWIRGGYTNADTGAMCIAGALGEREDVTLCPISKTALLFVAHVIGGTQIFCVPEFNDNPKTTHADVIAALELAYEVAGKNPHFFAPTSQ